MCASWKWERCLSMVNSMCSKYCVSKKEHTINAAENFPSSANVNNINMHLLHLLWNKQLCIEVKAQEWNQD